MIELAASLENQENINAELERKGHDDKHLLGNTVEMQLLYSIKSTLGQLEQFQRQQQTQTHSTLEALAKNTSIAQQSLKEQEDRLHELTISNKLQDLGLARDQKMQIYQEQQARVKSLKETLVQLRNEVKALHQDIIREKECAADPNYLKLCIYRDFGITFLDVAGRQCLLEDGKTLSRYHATSDRTDAFHANSIWSMLCKESDL